MRCRPKNKAQKVNLQQIGFLYRPLGKAPLLLLRADDGIEYVKLDDGQVVLYTPTRCQA